MNVLRYAGQPPQSRRFFMERTAKSMLGVSLAASLAGGQKRAMAQSGGGKAEAVIYIYLSGGMSHLDTFDPKERGADMGETTLISTNVDGIQFGDQLPKLAQHADKMAVINSMSSTNGAHEQGAYIMTTAYEKRATIVHPTIGPLAQELLGKKGDILPDSVVVGRSTSNAGYLDPALSPLPIADPSGGVPNSMITTSDERFERRMEIAKTLGSRFSERYSYDGPRSYIEYYDQATQLLKSDELEAFDLSSEPLRSKYGEDSRLGQGCLLARRLVQRGVRVVEVHSGGWDMHENLNQRMGDQGPNFDNALATLLEDLAANGMLETTLVAVGTEFGRTPKLNMNAGRDHFPAAYSAILAGGGVVGGQKYGATDKQGRSVAENPVKPEDFISTIGYALGVPLDETIYSPTRRPFTFGHDGEPVTSIFG